jgi:S1-C subfamily serine protease
LRELAADTTSLGYCRWMAAALLVAIAGCGGSSDTAPSNAAAATAPAGRLDLSIVAVTARIGGELEYSSGVVVDEDRGLILTTAHGVWGATSLKVATGIAVLHGRIVARDACDDIAVLETQPRLPGLVAVPPTSDDTLLAGRPIVAVRRKTGLPRGSRPDLITSRVAVRAGAARRLAPGVAPKGAVALEAPELTAAASGAPLLGADGRLAGLAQIVRRAGKTTRAALPWETISARLGELQPGGRAQYVGWREHYRCNDALQAYARERHPGFRRRDARLNAPVPATRLPGTEGVDR